MAATLIILGFLVTAAMAADQGGDSNTVIASSGWHFTLETYGWAFGMDGKVGVGGREANIDDTFIGILQKSNSLIGFQGHADIRHDNVGFYVDGIYADIESDFRQGRFSSTIVQQLSFLEGGAFFRFVEGLPLWHPSADIGGGTITIDGLMGARYTYLNLDSQNSLDAFGRTIKRDFGAAQDWVDPIVGGRMLVRLTDRFDFLLRDDVGGFNAGSKFT